MESVSIILTIAVPIFNMERWLRKNLRTYCGERTAGRLEVIALNNASEDASKEIALEFCREYPDVFRLLDRDSRGYGSSINQAISEAKGKYFRIVDADDWVDTKELERLLDYLEECTDDVVQTDYCIVNIMNNEYTPVRVVDKGVLYFEAQNDFAYAIKTLPSIHSTTYKTSLLRDSRFHMQDKMFFVDEEYVVLPYFYARSIIYFDCDVYRYQVANPEQSTSPANRAKYQEHREKVLKRLITEYQAAELSGISRDVLAYCHERIRRGVGDHFTTLYMYVSDRRRGRRLAVDWRSYIEKNAPVLYAETRKKESILRFMNLLHISLKEYELLKRWLIPQK